jgi:hypothetical protein
MMAGASIVFALGIAALVCGCGGPASSYLSQAATRPSSDQVEQACIVAASDRLSRFNGLSPSNGRAGPPATSKLDEGLVRLVEVDATISGRVVSYAFSCLYDPGTSTAFASPIGRSS